MCHIVLVQRKQQQVYEPHKSILLEKLQACSYRVQHATEKHHDSYNNSTLTHLEYK